MQPRRVTSSAGHHRDLRHPYLAHGQLLVAMTRGRNAAATHYLVPEEDMHEDEKEIEVK